MLMYISAFLIGCRDAPKTSTPEPEDPGPPIDTAEDTDTDDTDTDTDTDTDDTDVVEVDPIEEGRTATTICSAGGHVEGSSISGSFCFGAVDMSPGVQATSASFQWQPGPIYPVSP
jgi:hypothetical protein